MSGSDRERCPDYFNGIVTFLLAACPQNRFREFGYQGLVGDFSVGCFRNTTVMLPNGLKGGTAILFCSYSVK